MYVTPKNFGVAPDDLHQVLAYFTRLFGGSNRWRGVNPKGVSYGRGSWVPSRGSLLIIINDY